MATACAVARFCCKPAPCMSSTLTLQRAPLPHRPQPLPTVPRGLSGARSATAAPAKQNGQAAAAALRALGPSPPAAAADSITSSASPGASPVASVRKPGTGSRCMSQHITRRTISMSNFGSAVYPSCCDCMQANLVPGSWPAPACMQAGTCGAGVGRRRCVRGDDAGRRRHGRLRRRQRPIHLRLPQLAGCGGCPGVGGCWYRL